MLIACPQCATTYNVDPASLGFGRSVRCVRCKRVWFATADAPAARTFVAPDDIAVVQAPEAAEAGLPPEAERYAADAAGQSDDEAAEARLDAAWAHPQDAAPEDGEPAVARHAEFYDPQVLTEAPPLVPMEADPTPLPAEVAMAPSVGTDIESVAARGNRRHRDRRRWSRRGGLPLPGMPATTLALVALVAGLIAWRHDMVRIAPQTASLYSALGLPVNLRGLTFANVKTGQEIQDGVAVLVLEGTIVSASSKPVEVPRLRFALRNASGNEVYTWTALPDRKTLKPGETLPFRTHVAQPPADGRDVLVRFFNSRDIATGIN